MIDPDKIKNSDSFSETINDALFILYGKRNSIIDSKIPDFKKELEVTFARISNKKDPHDIFLLLMNPAELNEERFIRIFLIHYFFFKYPDYKNKKFEHHFCDDNFNISYFQYIFLFARAFTQETRRLMLGIIMVNKVDTSLSLKKNTMEKMITFGNAYNNDQPNYDLVGLSFLALKSFEDALQKDKFQLAEVQLRMSYEKDPLLFDIYRRSIANSDNSLEFKKRINTVLDTVINDVNSKIGNSKDSWGVFWDSDKSNPRKLFNAFKSLFDEKEKPMELADLPGKKMS